MTTPETERRPAALWKAMTEAQRQAAAQAFWDDDESVAEQTEVMLLLSKKLNFRYKSVEGKQTTLAARVVNASRRTPRRSYRTRIRRSPLSQLMVRSTTHRTFPRPLPCGVRLLAMKGSMPSQANSHLVASLS